MLGDIPTVFIFANTNHFLILYSFLVCELLAGFLVFGVLELFGFMDVKCHPFPLGQA
jgi:hypothetical protein